MTIGPTLPISQAIHAEKYRDIGETFDGMCVRICRKLADNDKHFNQTLEILREQRFLPAGRVQAAVGSPKQVTAFNCFVASTIDDSSDSIFAVVKEAWDTMRKGGGIGFDFSTLRPRGDLIESLNSRASGPVSFMDIFDATCRCVQSAGHRRGAMLGALRVDHPDIMEFIRAKQTPGRLTAFNVSVGATDEFMEAVKSGKTYWTTFKGKKYQELDARTVWDIIMDNTWDWAEPGVLFVDRINNMNNLWYAETIVTTNPCGEQPLPPNGACLLGSFNLVKYVTANTPELYPGKIIRVGAPSFNYDQFEQDIRAIVPFMDNIIDNTIYPLRKQEIEAKNKRRMGLGITGVANALEIMGYSYGSEEYIKEQSKILEILRDVAYDQSVEVARVKGVFPLFDAEKWLESGYGQSLPQGLKKRIRKYGLRNSHLLSIAPCGTISLCADNVSSGIEPVFSHEQERTINESQGPVTYKLTDYAYRTYGLKGKTADQVTAEEHIKVQCAAQYYVDSSVSKTCNIGPDVGFREFQGLYMMAYEGGAKGCTTFRATGKRMGILKAVETKDDGEGKACTIDPTTGIKTCDE